ncbi:hypothetical protein PQO01_18850 [Lentisphaera marina]|uniref:YkgJ family cysteine cluster protein n=1 Tax=Lentisphaera marina TaxID=1111041 RepID=UPI0023655E94|nr:hypothetical protein [Lentisphaera marina]MDD7987013.1 hypothetical protein [Lentisphaera marina]
MTRRQYNEQEICKSCGLCCDGTIFDHTSIEKNEIFPNIIQYKNKKYGLRQPCCYFDKQCTIYNDKRPKDCSTYKCDLLKSLSSHQLELDQVITLIRHIKTQKTRLYQLIPNANTKLRLEDNFNNFLEKNKPKLKTKQFKNKYSSLLLEWALYQQRLLRFHDRTS